MKVIVLLVAMTLASSFVMAGGGQNQIKKQDLYDVNGIPVATVIKFPSGCTAVSTQGGDVNSVIVTCDEYSED